MTLPTHHPAWVEVDLDVLVSNARVLREVVPPPARLGILVKANGYGHGIVESARAALAGGADKLVVAGFDEGRVLREAGIPAPVLVVYPVAPDVVVEAARLDLELSVSGLASVRQLVAAIEAGRGAMGGRLAVHVEVDSGMARGGARPRDVPAVLELLGACPGVEVIGLWSHLLDGSSPDATLGQVREFELASNLVAGSGRRLPDRHLVASEGLFRETAPLYDMARIGLAFYGELGLDVDAAPGLRAAASRLRPAMTVAARAVHLEPVAPGATVGYGGEWTATRPSLVATLPIGYADGWTRRSWPGGEVLVRGRRVPVVGRISMDSTCVDVTDVAGVGLEDEYVLLGPQGSDRITANELARLRGSIPNEVLATLGPRLPRVYRGTLAT
jgi:alanine racemase